MREMKFRAWDIQSKNYHRVNDLYWFEEHCVNSFQDDYYIFEQFTGKILNDKELYEGDIVRSPHFVDCKGVFHYLYHSIVWSDKLTGWMLVSPSAKDEYDGCVQLWTIMKSGAFEIVGNIHENPELLK